MNRGPIPVGTYVISEGYLDPVRPDISYRLIDKARACPKRNGFLIHHGTQTPPVWSTACIIIPDTVGRDMLNRYGGGTLEVIGRQTEKGGFSAASCSDPTFGANMSASSQPPQEQCKGLYLK